MNYMQHKMNYKMHVHNLIILKSLNHNMIKLNNKIRRNFEKEPFFFVLYRFYLFRLRTEINNLQNEIESTKPLLNHYKAQIDILEKRTPTILGKFLNFLF